ncbi:MAG: hypothetical protein H7338_22600 [Candidatus Sericytochromatia bacterium]|nr:hypothetical protein [Candidatus Sericytochromatia bacterium]
MAPNHLRPDTVCRVGDLVTLTVPEGVVGEWSYEARVLWLRAGHVGLTPPTGSRWQSLLSPGRGLFLDVRQGTVAARLRLVMVGLTADLPPVLVVHRPAESVTTPPAASQTRRASPG